MQKKTRLPRKNVFSKSIVIPNEILHLYVTRGKNSDLN